LARVVVAADFLLLLACPIQLDPSNIEEKKTFAAAVAPTAIATLSQSVENFHGGLGGR
jgi:hypothetical protein